MDTREKQWELLAKEVDRRGGDGKAVVEAYKELYSVHSEKICSWLGGLYDPEVGGFYYSNSARDNEYWEREDGTRHYYVTPVDWYNQPDFKRHATLHVGADRYALSLDFGTIVKILATDTAAAWTEEDTAEVLSVTESEVTLQGLDTVTLHVVRGGKETVVSVDCTKKPVQTVAL